MPVEIVHGDCLEHMAAMKAAGRTIDAVVTDPPYHLVSQDKRDLRRASGDPRQRAKIGGFMNCEWDGGDIAFRPETWRLAYDLLPPGGMMACFGGSRTQHRMACAVEDAGFEIRDTLMWLYGSGFPKSRALPKPAYEPIILARKPGPLRHLGIDACRVATNGAADPNWRRAGRAENAGLGYRGGGTRTEQPETLNPAGRWPSNILHDGSPEVLGAFAAFGERQSGKPGVMRKGRNDGACYGSESRPPGTVMTGFGDTGTAARFFPALGYAADELRFMYCGKASGRERMGCSHPTVKPLSLVRWIARLITPPGGTVLDCFAGSGTTGLACLREGLGCVLVEREAEYLAMIRKRLGLEPFALEAAD